ncbi:molybdenum cofactor biosynthesis protein [Desulfomarina profundi]|uniref:Molybdenum cofactor biosynthesis protein B n=1 Tax=Desulfomarina profundi TaxID=2772557 RepID=A0A8D5JP05_9BACT|nr:MogA/MoaB family molybdenum cofactor biosynthesis protein [Desulfomarina profundi]BCL60740.1 molybdenum cofactor biosynthesis protein [Desulfomarina profundi]
MDNQQEQYSCAVLTLSDKGSRGEREDTSGEFLKKTLTEAGFILQSYEIIPDRKEIIIQSLKDLVDNKRITLIVTTGGTGVSPTDVTPEAMEEVVEKEVPGMAEAMRAASLLKTNRAMLSRGKVGIRGMSLIINLPGSLKAARENLEVVLPVIPHALEKILGGTSDCGAE